MPDRNNTEQYLYKNPGRNIIFEHYREKKEENWGKRRKGGV